MNFKHLLLSSIPQAEKMLEYGFEQNGKVFELKTKLDEEFYVVVIYDSENLNAEVFENDTDEKYVLLDVKTAHGAFVNGIREKVRNLMADITEKCFSVTLYTKMR